MCFVIRDVRAMVPQRAMTETEATHNMIMSGRGVVTSEQAFLSFCSREPSDSPVGS